MRLKIPQLLFAGATLAAFLTTSIGAVAQSTPSRSLLALSKRSHTLAIVDPNTLQVIAHAPSWCGTSLAAPNSTNGPLTANSLQGASQ